MQHASGGILERQLVPVQPVSGAQLRVGFESPCTGVQPIPDRWMSHVRTVAPDLVLAPGHDLHGQLAKSAIVPEPFQHLPPCDAQLPTPSRSGRLLDALPLLRTDLTGRRGPAVAERCVLAADFSRIELHLQVVPGLKGLRKKNQAGAWHIKAMQEAMVATSISKNRLLPQGGPYKVEKLKLGVLPVDFPVGGLVHHSSIYRVLPQKRLASLRTQSVLNPLILMRSQ